MERIKLKCSKKMENIIDEILLYLPLKNERDNIFHKRIECDQSFLEIQKSELELLKSNILRSLIDLQLISCHDAEEKIERKRIVDLKMEKIALLEKNIVALELELQQINQTRIKAAKEVESERNKLRVEVEKLMHYQRLVEEKRMIRELVLNLALPDELFNYNKIDQLLEEHQRQIDRLERMKIGATPSQIEIINKQIAELEKKLNDALNEINFQIDKNGRKFYYDQNGCKKFLNEFRVFMDELGDYILDENGEKKYLREYAYDEHGRYYLTEDGIRIYKATPHSPEYRLYNGVLMRICKMKSSSETSIDVDRRKLFPHYVSGDSAYLDFLMEHYAKPLKEALTKIIFFHPIDPIDYLEKYLDNYQKVKRQSELDKRFFDELSAKRKIVARQMFQAQIEERRKLVNLKTDL